MFAKQPGGKCVRNRKQMFWRNGFRMRGCARQVPFQNPGTSKGLEKCLNAKRHSGQLAPFNNIFPPPKKFHRIPPKSHATHILSSGKVHQDIRSASCMFPTGSSVKQNRRENRETARLEGITICKTFWPRLCYCSYIVTIFPYE